MLRSRERVPRRSISGGRTKEIQRLIGRSLRAAVDEEAMGEIMARVDCDVLQADGGTHVRNTSEVGRIRIADYKSKGRINKRIYVELEA